MSSPDCPTRDELLWYVAGRLSEGSADAVSAHVAVCPDCRAVLSTLDDAEDTLADELRRLAVEDPYHAEAECTAAVSRLEAMAGGRSTVAEFPAMGSLGEYEFLEEIGHGAMGTVFKARHKKLGRSVALKLLPAEHVGDQRAIERFEREMMAVGSLNHPNIVRAHDAREIEGVRLLAMEFVDGMDLSKLVHYAGPLPIADACEIVRQAAVGLQYAHENDRVHRDVKPSNLMLDRDGQVRVLDLGLALLQADQPAGSEMTGYGQALGTPDCMAPEQVYDAHAVDFRADVYGLGCTLYKLLSGRYPFSGPRYATKADKMRGHTQDPVPPINEHRGDVPEELIGLLDRMLAKDPAQRSDSVKEVADALVALTVGADLARLLARAERARRSESEAAETPATDPLRGSAVVDTKWPVSTPTQPAGSLLRRHSRLIAVAASLAGVLLLGVVLTVRGRYGTLTIDVSDPNVQVAVKQGGELVEALDAKSGWTIRLNSGKYDIELQAGQDQFKLDNDTVTVTRGGKVQVKVTLKRPAEKAREDPSVAKADEGQDRPPKPAEVDNEPSDSPDDPDREVAKWAVSHGGNVTVRRNDKTVETCHVADFPSEPFSVVTVDMTSCTYRPTDADVVRFLSLKQLAGVQLLHTDLTDDGLRQISQISSLRLLWCRSDSFTDEGIKHLARMPKLNNISLVSSPGPTERGLAELCSPRMQYLYLSGQSITDTFMRNLSRCPHLRQIHLNDTHISDTGLVSLGGLQSLTVLHLAETNITDSGIAHLAKLPSLTSLNLSQTKITDSGMGELAKCSTLQWLAISYTRVTDRGLSQLASLPKLTALYATGTDVTDAGVASFRKARPSCAVYY